jgi:hypothetical protein
MSPGDISIIRSYNQQIATSKFKTASEVASWMGAIQAQDYSMSKWAFGIRLPDSTEEEINNAIDTGRIIRTHLLRPTWHFVSSNDIYWILELTAPQIKSVLKYRDKQLGLTDTVLQKCNKIIEKSLRNGNHLTREELLSGLVKNKIDLENNRASHILLRAEMDGIICSGKQKKGKPTYAILGEWVPPSKKIKKDEALKELARRYFSSHGPATIQDFTWWSGLSVRDAKNALELNKEQLISEVLGSQTYWLADLYYQPMPGFNEICFLPAYDEFLISYRDRTASLALVDNKKAVSENGIFYPTVLKSGQVIGTWKRNIKNDRIGLNINLFNQGNPDREYIQKKFSATYSKFVGREFDLI